MKPVIFFLTIFALLISSPFVAAQKRFAKTYPASENVRLQLTNRSGTVTVSGWDNNQISITAQMELPAAKIEPTVSDGTLTINVVRDNSGRGNVGNVNFEVKVPYGSTVDIETVMGNLTVRDINGSMVRANITTEGDITLTNIKSQTVMAQNIIGDIFFDGELKSNGSYRFDSTRGNINIRIPFSSSFKLIATAPSTKQIELGSFSNAGLNFVSNGQRVVGSVGSAEATLTIVNKRGTISFIRR